MKITKDTKIGDIIPEGYELIPNSMPVIRNPEDASDDKDIKLCIRKKEVKNFDWYIIKYLDNQTYIREQEFYRVKKNFTEKNFEGMSFEIKIGLLKFIYNDQKMLLNEFLDTLKDSLNKELDKKHSYSSTQEMLKICPKEFLTSIFK